MRAYGESDSASSNALALLCGGFAEIVWSISSGRRAIPARRALDAPPAARSSPSALKPAMVEAGRWRATAPHVEGHAGFRLNALVSVHANASWGRLAEEFVRAKDDPAELQTFVNTILAQGWRAPGEDVDESALAGRAEPFGLDRIPPEVLVVTVGVDVQDDRLECAVCGWTRASECLVLGHIVIWGAHDDDTTWMELDELLKTRWPHPHGGRLRVDACAIDAGDGQHFDKVLSFAAAAGLAPGDGDQGRERNPPGHSGEPIEGEGRRKVVDNWRRRDQVDDFRPPAARPDDSLLG